MEACIYDHPSYSHAYLHTHFSLTYTFYSTFLTLSNPLLIFHASSHLIPYPPCISFTYLGYPSPSASDPSSIIPYETQLRRAKSLIPRVSLISTSLNDEKEEFYRRKHNHKEGDSSGFISTMRPFNDFRKGTPKQ